MYKFSYLTVPESSATVENMTISVSIVFKCNSRRNTTNFSLTNYSKHTDSYGSVYLQQYLVLILLLLDKEAFDIHFHDKNLFEYNIVYQQ